ncbi:hypothetical protein AKUH4B504J_01110 [Apilactobacillus kunkeei]|uniref:DUF805 domain-containing protein n=1 Tax=Apilactobacillus kunkeei TaxID=148814 RepID=UPI0021E27D4D|nr:hypothetical protein AKUH4B504J_01110 [Apilactobacillus kunkeei]
MNNKFCPKCGQELDINAKFCNKCGFEQASETQNSNINNQTQQNANVEEKFVNDGYNQQRDFANQSFAQQNNVTFADAMSDMFKRLFTISGCSTRAQFWYGQLVLTLCLIVLRVLLLAVYNPLLNSVGGFRFLRLIIIVVSLLTAFLNTVGIILMFRRLHDANLSGNFLWLGLIPIVGWIILIVLFCQPSKQEGKDRFGDYVAPTKTAIIFGCAVTVIFWVITTTSTTVTAIEQYHWNYEYTHYNPKSDDDYDTSDTDSSSDDTY